MLSTRFIIYTRLHMLDAYQLGVRAAVRRSISNEQFSSAFNLRPGELN